ncbi:hypothetical protein BN1723_006288 [Verticillium longisporum]|uniref:holo-[acyl-carrier-protein] synthase n=1 Tax=Verticillium longisporum TaxID=100787 RepID=A0A0G4NE57_VERLO|nr:hypothetical protein BN1723_006288 [Verticillium longisporum]
MASQPFHNDFFNTVMNRPRSMNVPAQNTHDGSVDSQATHIPDDSSIPAIDIGRPLVPINDEPMFSRGRILPTSIDSLVNHRSTNASVSTNASLTYFEDMGQPTRNVLVDNYRPARSVALETLRSHGQLYDKTPSSSDLADRSFNQPAFHEATAELAEYAVKCMPGYLQNPSGLRTKRERDGDEELDILRPRSPKRLCSERSPVEVARPALASRANDMLSEEALRDHPALRLLGDGWDDIHSQMGFADTTAETHNDEQLQDAMYHSTSRIMSRIAMEHLDEASRALALLTPDERAGVLRFYHVRDAKLSLGSHLLKRHAIARFCGVPWSRAAYVKMTGEALLAPWLRDLEFRGFRAPAAASGKEGGRLNVDEAEGTAVRQHEIYLEGKKVEDANVCLKSVGPDYMVCAAVRTPGRKGEGLALRLGDFELVRLEELIAFAEAAS